MPHPTDKVLSCAPSASAVGLDALHFMLFMTINYHWWWWFGTISPSVVWLQQSNMKDIMDSS